MTLNYNSDPMDQVYRVTTFDGIEYRESLRPILSNRPVRKIMPGKIHAHPWSESTVRWLQEHSVFCFGRFATWRPDELGHETWKHIQKAVNRWI